MALTSAMLGLLFAKFLTDTVGLPPALVAVAVFVGRTWDWVNDPILGYISDHIHTRWGRRRPFLLFGALPFGLTFLALWWIPPIQSHVWLTVYYTVVFFLFDTAVTIIFIPYIALTPEITDDYDGRTSLTGFRMFFSLTGSLLGTVYYHNPQNQNAHNPSGMKELHPISGCSSFSNRLRFLQFSIELF